MPSIHKFPAVILFLAIAVSLFSQSPHGDDLKIGCADCHNPKGWKLEKGTYTFDHSSTKFLLEGQHQDIDCKMCHISLVFSKAETECISCHADMHYQTVGPDCSRCHTPKSWIVTAITRLHQESRFPLLGAHATADCYSCHPSASLLRFEPLGVDCYDCHRKDYEATTSPKHTLPDYPTECTDCHLMTAFTWTGANFNHSIFPLTGGHAINDCKKCHTQVSYSDISAECVSCHQTDYNNAANPNHLSAGLSTNCNDCHTTKPDWKPADFKIHDGQYFPVYSGKHKGEWNLCTDCHKNAANYAENTCIDCHEHNQSDMNNKHNDVGGYIYNSAACLECHPTGDAEGGFNHNTSNFPLTGAHITTECIGCHATGYAGTTTVCYDCHVNSFNQSINPNHTEINTGTDCATCHTTAPDWQPATFPIHDQSYPLTGAHGRIATDCFACHQGNYVNSPNTCYGCHSNNYNQTTNPPHATAQFSTACETCHNNEVWSPSTFNHSATNFPLIGAHTTVICISCHANGYTGTSTECASCHLNDYNQTTNPPHASIQFPTDCQSCHTQTAWQPSTFNHDGQYFPIYSGKHNGQWTVCADCHTNPSNYAVFTCTTTCHPQSSTDQAHNGIQGYSYNSTSCLACHPDGSGGNFNHNTTNFPLTGAHTSLTCISCHESGYAGTPTDCQACHSANYNQTTNPNHSAAGISTDCASCHTTNPDWKPATFAIHNQYYPLTGAHTSVATDCFTCHNGNYNNTPNVCVGCHQNNYNQATNPNHNALGISTDCAVCHTTNPDWKPATFATHNQYYVLQGAHAAIANDCFTCHNGNYNSTPNTCFACHTADYNQTNNPPHAAAQFPTDCETCHSQNAWQPSTFNHDGQYFPIYSGKHNGEWNTCSECHPNPSNYSIFTCTTSCHPQSEMNQKHNGIPGYSYNSVVCLQCHPDGSGGNFNHNSTNFPLTGAHTSLTCISCHENGFIGTPTDCQACHSANYNQTTNPNHSAAGISTDCASCHTTNPDWKPATFAIHNQYYPLTGAHAGVATDCFTCHNGNYNNTPNVCVGCHQNNYNQATNPNHNALGISTDCAVCHTTNPDWKPATFATHNQYYVLQGAHAAIANDCFTCHNGNYNSTPNTCFACHSADYNQTNNPPHVSAQFPTDCETCHTQNAWQPSTFNHDGQYFPIYSGKHDGEWNTCSECHPNPSNYSIFTCTTSCHPQSEMNQKHNGVSGYQYNSIACLQCHPTGNTGRNMLRLD